MNEHLRGPRFRQIPSPPLLHHAVTVPSIMLWVLVALVPAAAFSVYFFQWRAAVHLLVCTACAVGTEAAIQKLRKVPVTVNDLSAVVSGLLLGLTMPPGAPFWISACGAVFAMGLVKQAFGGLGQNFMNPALAARAFVAAAWPLPLASAWVLPHSADALSGMPSLSLDAIASATPLAALQRLREAGMPDTQVLFEALMPLFWGNRGGCIGETSAAALLAGAAILLVKRYIDYRIPLSFMLTVFFISWLGNGSHTFFTLKALVYPAFQLMAGGLVLGAFFMAADPVTSPATPVGKIIFGIGCGCVTMLIRLKGGYPEGVCYAILVMNAAAPLLDKIRLPKKYGEKAGAI